MRVPRQLVQNPAVPEEGKQASNQLINEFPQSFNCLDWAMQLIISIIINNRQTDDHIYIYCNSTFFISLRQPHVYIFPGWYTGRRCPSSAKYVFNLILGGRLWAQEHRRRVRQNKKSNVGQSIQPSQTGKM